MNDSLGLFVDDERDPPENDGVRWIIARTFHRALCWLEDTDFDIVSLDHDLACFYGNKELKGRQILDWLIERKINHRVTPDVVKVHSENPVGCATMREDIKRYWP